MSGEATSEPNDPADLLRQVVAALRYQRWHGADVIDRAWASPLPVVATPQAPERPAEVRRDGRADMDTGRRAPEPRPAQGPGVEPGPRRVLPPVARPEPEQAAAPRVLPPVVRQEPLRVRPSRAQAETALHELRQTIGDCQRCSHAGGRDHIVHGTGNPMARLMIVGSGPGAGEDAAGMPWQGEAGELLDKMLGAMGLPRGEVWLTSLVLCRAPDEGPPQREAITACSQFLRKQWDILQPEAVLAFGEPAARFLLRSSAPLTELRGRWQPLMNSQVLATWSPEDAVRAPGLKREVWADLQLVMARLGLQRK